MEQHLLDVDGGVECSAVSHLSQCKHIYTIQHLKTTLILKTGIKDYSASENITQT